MAKTYTYPRVTISTKALKRSVGTEVVEDTTNLFVPILASRGPVDEVVAVHSLDEYIEKFGELSYETQGQTALNLMNWLLAGGTAYVYRLSNEQTCATFENAGYNGSISAKYPGTEYSKAKIEVVSAVTEKINNTPKTLKYKVTVKDSSGVSVETFYIRYDDKDVSSKSDYLSYIDITKFSSDREVLTNSITFSATPADQTIVYPRVYFYDLKDKSNIDPTDKTDSLFEEMIANNGVGATVADSTITLKRITKTVSTTADGKKQYSYTINDISNTTPYLPAVSADTKVYIKVGEKTYELKTDGSVAAADSLSTAEVLILNFWTAISGAQAYLLNKLETPIDMILDAAYPLAIKEAIFNFVKDYRNDIVVLFDQCSDKGVYNGKLEDCTSDIETSQTANAITNYAVYAQKLLISEETLSSNPRDIWVSPTYFLASLIPYNDLTYGIQMPTAGERRGVLQGVKKIDVNPLPDTKQDYFDSRINYIEKDTRGYYFMNQRTHDGSTASNYTALSFLNNERVKEKMVRDLEKLGRNYLFEFNDSTTLQQLSTALNTYVTTWIANRTLDKGYVEVKKSKLSDEAVDVTLNIRFTGTIEVISIDITIE